MVEPPRSGGRPEGRSQLGDRGIEARHQLELLFPPPLQVRRGAPEESAVARWLAVPDGADPRLLVGVTGRHAAVRVIRRQMSGRRPRTIAARWVFSALAWIGLLQRRSSGQWAVQGPVDAPSLARRIAEVLEVSQVSLSLAIGPARANRKPILQVTDAHGSVLAFAKVGHDALTRALVEREAAALSSLADRVPRVQVPRVLATLEWAGCQVMLLSPLRIPRKRVGGAVGDQRLKDVVRQIAAVDGLREVAWTSHPLRARLANQCAGLGTAGERIAALLDSVPGEHRFTTGCWHGDFNAGNVALGRAATVVWDWERFESGAPLGFDLLHHQLHRDITERGTDPAQAARRLVDSAPAELADLGCSVAEAAWTARLYLATLAVRYLGDDQEGAGADLGLVQEWLFPVLEDGGR